jgi:hypothetical protein
MDTGNIMGGPDPRREMLLSATTKIGLSAAFFAFAHDLKNKACTCHAMNYCKLSVSRLTDGSSMAGSPD